MSIINYNIFISIYNLAHCRILTSQVWTDDSRLLQELSLAARKPRRAHLTSYKQPRVKDLPKVPTWRLVGSNQRSFALKTTKGPSCP